MGGEHGWPGGGRLGAILRLLPTKRSVMNQEHYPAEKFIVLARARSQGGPARALRVSFEVRATPHE